MRVVYLHQYFNTPAMAGGTRSYEMARRLVAAGHDVQMVTTWREPDHRRTWFTTTESGVRVHWLPVVYSNRLTYRDRLKAFGRFAWASARKAASLGGDVVFATSTPLTIAIPGIYASCRRRVPMVFEIRDVWPDVPIAMGVLRNPIAIGAARSLERIAYRHATRIVALAPGMKEALCRRGIEPSRVAVIPNGCDFDVFGDGRAEPAVLPPAEGAPATIVYIGTMGVANGVDYIPRMAAAVQARAGAAAVRFFLIGDGSARDAVEAQARALGVLDRTVFFVGSLPKRETARWVAAADATIMTYDGPEIVYRDSVSNKFFDSIAAGKPVFANFSGFSTLTAVEAGAGHILPRDPVAAADELQRLVADRAALARAGDAARRLAHDRFSRDRLATELERVLEAAVGDGARS